MKSTEWQHMKPEHLDGRTFTATTKHGATLRGTLGMTARTVLKDQDALAVILYMTPDGSMHLNEIVFAGITIGGKR
ncbi:MAG: hypothetical protein SOI13_05280 [Bifidobacterium mongoliense]|jgi:hypothetical protein|uniref:hypothetical protein n=1 Tax=Bifidobacterium mongoliense TaxID=518643 RepID=UPI002F35DAEB